MYQSVIVVSCSAVDVGSGAGRAVTSTPPGEGRELDQVEHAADNGSVLAAESVGRVGLGPTT